MKRAANSAGDALWKLYGQPRRAYSMGGVSAPSSRRLWDIVKKDLIEPHDAKHITDIWMEFHADPLKHRVATVIPVEQYKVIAQNAARSPMFILPIFKGPNAFETILVQQQLPVTLFTSLEEYKRAGAAAVPYLVATHYTEVSDKGIVLVRGDITNPNGITPFEAGTLLRLAAEFYSIPKKHVFVERFNHAPNEFNFKNMLDAMQHDTSNLQQ